MSQIQKFLEKGADANAVNCEGWPALMFASQQGHLGVVPALLAAGADVNTVDKNMVLPH